jgi:peptidoglycan/LPS O-acetylase OafA/YrhL
VLFNFFNVNISWISVARAISVVSIIIFHIYMGKLRYIFYEGTNVFFAISGYVIATSLMRQNFMPGGDWWAWWKRRLLRLCPLWLIVLLIAFIAFILNISWINLNVSSINRFVDLILHAFMLHVYSSSTYYSINIAWWFQGIIMQCYLLTPLFYYLVRSRVSTVSLVLIAWGSYVGANVLLKGISQSSNLISMYLLQATFGWFWYLMGMLYATRSAGRILVSSKNILKLSLPLFLACILYLIGCPHLSLWFETFSSTIFVFRILNSASIIYIAIMVSQCITEILDSKKIVKHILSSLVWFGSCSYAAYLTHMYFIPILALPLPWLLRIAAYFSTVLLASYVLKLTENNMRWFLEK